MTISRDIATATRKLARQYPVITITGPRQSGKTTLVRELFPGYRYASLEDPDVLEMALSDPRAFLKDRDKGVILDEIQRAPRLLSYIQGIVDDHKKSGQFILTGSRQFELMNTITQSLAGRTAILKLLPFTFDEVQRTKKKLSIDQYLFTGMYPGIYDRQIEPTQFYRNYFETYIERDLRQLLNVKDLRLFRKFVKLCAGRTGQLFSASNLAGEVGVSTPTIQSWISILEASYVVIMLEPYHANIGKRLIKSPKMYFYDTGLAAYLLGIESPKQMERDPLRGNLFENMVITEMIKQRFNRGRDHNMYFYRDSNGNEIDLLHITGASLIPVEIKSSETFNSEFLKGLRYFHKTFPEQETTGCLVYGGTKEQEGETYRLISFKNSKKILDI